MDLDDPNNDVPLPAFFESLSWDNRWEEAELEEVVLYLRTARAVTVPREFKKLIPKYVFI